MYNQNNQRRHFTRTLLAAGIALAVAGPAAAQLKQPYNLAVSYDATAKAATLSWSSDAPAAYGYAIERRALGSETWTQVAFKPEPTRSHTDAGLTPLTRYEYRVKTYRSGARGDVYPSTAVATALNFPYQTPYPNGITPTNYSQEQKNADVYAMWQAWRKAYLTSDGAGPGGLRVYKPTEGGESVSEGIGYGLLISVYMASDAPGNPGKSDFDGLLTYYKAKEKKVGSTSYGLMAWKINANGTIADNYVAPDGDIDAAFALLVADRKWGSAGAFNYRQEALRILNGLMAWVVLDRGANDSKLLYRSDMGNLTRVETGTDHTMSSYQIVSYLRQFAQASDPARAARWRGVLASGYKFHDYFYKANPTTGLTPYTFLTQPGANQYQKGVRGYNFGYDSCRTPWRLGLDYLWHGNANADLARLSHPAVHPTLARDMPARQVAWFNQVTGGNAGVPGNPQLAKSSYELHGAVSSGAWGDGQRNMASSMAVGAMTDPASQAWLNRAYTWMRAQVPGQSYTEGGVTARATYYGDTVLMVTMIAVTGNMPNLPGVGQP